MKRVIGLVLGVAFCGLFGCSSVTHQDVYTMAGGAAGGLLASQFGGGAGKYPITSLGIMAGMILGGNIGISMDELDRIKDKERFVEE